MSGVAAVPTQEEEAMTAERARRRDLPVLELPADRPRSRALGHRRGASSLPVPELGSGGRPPADAAVLLAAVAALAARTTGRREVVLGTPGVSGTDLLAVRFRIVGDPAFGELVEQSRAALRQAVDRGPLPPAPADPSFHPAVQVVAAVRGPKDAPLDLDALRLAPDAPPFDIVFVLDLASAPGELEADFDAERFATAGPVHLEALHAILAAGLADPALSVGSLPLVSDPMRGTLLGEWAVVRRDYPRERGIAELFAEQVAERPDAVAVVVPERGGGPARHVSFRELDLRTARLARRLAALGVSRGTPVVLALEHSLALVEAMVAVVRSGGVYVPIDAAYPPDRLAFMLEDAAAPVVLTRSGLVVRLPVPRGTEVVLLDALDPTVPAEDDADERGPLLGEADDLAYVTYTSGSTGRPKGVAVPQRGVVRLVKEADYARFSSDETFLHLAAVTFDLTTLEVWGPLLTGGRLVVFTDERPTPDRVAEALARERVTFLWLTAGLFHQMAEARPEGLAPVTQLLAGGDALAAGACRRVLEVCSRTLLIDGYGPTENTTFSSCHPMPTPASVTDPVSIGRPIANSEAFVLGTSMEPLPPLVPGELLVAGDGLARGYWNRPALTAEKFVPHPYADRPGERMYRTGDLARWRTDGTLEFLGRSDHQVKLRGFRIELTEIESVLATHAGVGEVVVVARDLEGPDGIADRTLVAYFVPIGVKAPAPRELRDHAARHLPEHMLPAAYVALAALPLSPNGKVDRKALPEPGPDDRASAAEHVAPRTATEATLAAIWGDVLGVSRVGLTDDFFALGGHSLLAASIFTRVADAFGVRMPVASIFRARTLGEFAFEVSERVSAASADPAGAAAALPPIGPRGAAYRQTAPLAHAQRGLWVIDQLRPESAVYNLPTVFRLRGGGLSAPALARALGEILRRHDGLRISFRVGVDGFGEQRFLPPAPGSMALPVVDLSGLPERVLTTAVTATLDAEARLPFTLSGDRPPVRALLVREAADDHRLLFHAHHIVFDGWSAEILAAELRALYGAAPGAPSSLPATPVGYADYAVWQHEVFTDERLAPEIEHWREHLADLPPVLELPTDRPRPKVLSDRGGEVRVRIEPAVRAGLEALARGEGATLFMALLAGFLVVLGRWSGRTDVAVGAPVAGRLRPELEGMLGFFVNTLVLRCDLAEAPSYRRLLAHAREETARALSHASVHFDTLAAELAADHGESHHPIVQVLFAGQDLDLLGGELAPGIAMEGETLGTGTAKVDLTLFADRRAGCIELRFEYSRDLFDRPTIERLSDHLGRLLRAAVAAPDAPLASLEMLGESERSLLLDDWRGHRTAYPRHLGLAELFDRHVAERPDAVAVAAAGGRGSEQLTYAGLDRRARALALRIAASPGFAPGTPVGLALERSADLVVAVLAAVRAGGLYVPLDADYPEERLAFLAQDAGVRVLVTEGRVLGRQPVFERLAADEGFVVLRLDAPAGQTAPSPFQPPVAGPGAAAYVCYTSGSTGKPKGAVVPQRAVARLVLEADYARFTPDETFLLLAPVSFDAATLELWGPLLTGGRLAVHPPERPTPEGLGEVLARERVTSLWLTAGLFHQVVEDAPAALAPLRRLLAGGDVLSPALCRRVLDAQPHLVLVNGYGPTENTTFTCCHAMTSAAAVEEPVPIGRPIHDTTAVIVDPALRLQPIGVPGELLTGGDGLASGYWHRPALTAERFLPDPFAAAPDEAGGRLYRTGDLARWRPDGTIEFLGRNDGQVKVRGFRIELGEIESALAAHPKVHRAVVVARAAAAGTDRVLVGYVVPEGDAAPEERELRGWLEARLPLHMVPGALPVLRELPLDPNGKVDRRALPDPAELPGAAGAPRAAPRTETERAVAAIWSEVLGIGEPALGDDFFRLGGHSLLAARVMSRVRAGLGVEMSLGRLFELRTLEAFAREVEAKRSDGTPPAPTGSIRRTARRRIVRRSADPPAGGDST